jgi:hypothetical protein
MASNDAGSEEVQANASLIAAAPDLLKAVVAIDAYVLELGSPLLLDPKFATILREKVGPAIEKAYSSGEKPKRREN